MIQNGSILPTPDSLLNKNPTKPREHNFFGCSPYSDYTLADKVGQGTFGEVHKAIHKKTGRLVALKRVLMHNEKEGIPITAIREIKILKSLNHSNIIPLVDMIVKHASNLLINNCGELFIADFGLARSYVPDAQRDLTKCVVTRWYRPPELLLGERKYTSAIDMWGVGCIAAEMLIKRPLFPGKTDIDQLEQIFKLCGSPNNTNWPGWDKLPDALLISEFNRYQRSIKEYFKNKFGEAISDFMENTLQLDPKLRLTALEALDHKIFISPPYPTKPEDMPKFESSHEYDRRKPADNNISNADQRVSPESSKNWNSANNPRKNQNNAQRNNDEFAYNDDRNRKFGKRSDDLNYKSKGGWDRDRGRGRDRDRDVYRDREWDKERDRARDRNRDRDYDFENKPRNEWNSRNRDRNFNSSNNATNDRNQTRDSSRGIRDSSKNSAWDFDRDGSRNRYPENEKPKDGDWGSGNANINNFSGHDNNYNNDGNYNSFPRGGSNKKNFDRGYDNRNRGGAKHSR
ncbi:Serine/threonine-protein kinase bur1 [Smittium culicis]|uniref:Serine/threonine-protein kinase bur1 n=1 Tax=Smittium culicis TaxID=133412 RepID=A0A1R1YCB4_9FUNG|nr:Serine/threonine-protein kinase bur1 [Smittium culicis]OMJ24557.1 Serine/threonine-protein kinase bur1 [Smittium culicis]